MKGKFLEMLGHYLPARTPAIQEVKQERVKFWMSKGAIPTNTTARLFKKIGMEGMEKYIETYTKKKTKFPGEVAATPVAAPAPAAV